MGPSFKTNEDLLRYLYADLTRISEISSPHIVLHRFDDPSVVIRGVTAVQRWEEDFVAAGGGVLVMDVQSVVANAHFGTVLGVVRAKSPRRGIVDLAVPFCGVWRFVDGKAVEHWEHAAEDPRVMKKWFESQTRSDDGR